MNRQNPSHQPFYPYQSHIQYSPPIHQHHRRRPSPGIIPPYGVAQSNGNPFMQGPFPAKGGAPPNKAVPSQNGMQPYYSNASFNHSPTIPVTPFQKYSKPSQPSYLSNYGTPGMGPKNNGWMDQWIPYQSAPFPQQGNMPKGFMNYFHDEDGQLDIDKMLSTFGKVADTVKQVSPMVKGLGTFIKPK
ncbi:YppG family protein [Aquibacillus sp. 3ASR75-11]|uniref:YppG family protein n=1 Tax=Terrihalobacillus insolitus TaxID=2950438 RepID=A0A9X4AMA0_9BACI|nr:YppG family protein [Terrihalobacillus insolitus]MDC3413131.1 YppG family protein [Terrihalobacillus insolitus]MDC3425197.1 YppG family protein [Terrihalobacillus insolitus]